MTSSIRVVGHLVAVGAVFLVASVGWMILGGVTSARVGDSSSSTSYQVVKLWGNKQVQRPPTLTFVATPTLTNGQPGPSNGSRNGSRNGSSHGPNAGAGINAPVTPATSRWAETATPPQASGNQTANQAGNNVQTNPQAAGKQVVLASTDVKADIESDLRRKGLIWHSLYNVNFSGDWSYTHNEDAAGSLDVAFAFPHIHGNYDQFSFMVDGEEHGSSVAPSQGTVAVNVPVEPGQTIHVHVGYRSRGKEEWTYQPGQGVGVLRDFSLAMTTDFSDIDFPAESMSPTRKRRAGAGWALDWKFDRVVTGQAMGLITPTRIQPGDLAAKLAFSAPISLGLFFVVMMAIALLRNIQIHPINYFFLAGAFFAFHLLFAYSVDHLSTEVAFAVSSAVSLGLVVSYLRLVVSTRFAFLEAAGAQLLYLIGFSLAHFWDGYTGLTVTVLGIVTLFALMQLTGKIRWGDLQAFQKSPWVDRGTVAPGVPHPAGVPAGASSASSPASVPNS